MANRAFPISRIALVLAALAAAFAVGFAISQDRQTSPANGNTSSTASGIAELQAKTQAEPDNVAGWLQLGAARFEREEFAAAVKAYQQATRLSPDRPGAWAALGEAMVMASESDPMPEEALAAFRKAHALDKADPRARYFLAVSRDLGGDHTGAIADWLALLKDTPADAPWRTDLIRTIEQVAKINQMDVSGKLAAATQAARPRPAPVAAQAIPGPDRQDLAAASAIPPHEQRQMAEGMVARLEQRLAGDPSNVDGWVMLMRSRVTLNQPDMARRALREAIAANPGRAGFLQEQAQILGID